MTIKEIINSFYGKSKEEIINKLKSIKKDLEKECKMEEKIYYILTDTYVHECIGKESLKKKVNALQVLGIDFEVFQKVDGEERKVLVGINDFLKVLGV